MVCPPTTAGRWLTEQLLRAGRAAGWVLALPRLQLLALKLPPPGGTLLALQLTVPLGALAELGVLSVTVPVQLVGLPTGTGSGEQLTTRLVACLDRKSVVQGKSVDLGGRRIIKKKKVCAPTTAGVDI